MSRVEGMVGGRGGGEAAWGPAQRIGDGERSDKLTGRDDSFAPGNRQGPRLSLSKESQWG